jgi:hypothetical protein
MSIGPISRPIRKIKGELLNSFPAMVSFTSEFGLRKLKKKKLGSRYVTMVWDGLWWGG